ncbi:HpcH/HpaI aldolase/citrate lyase family protein [Mameliella sediminis]|uniref:HpcH/HpaI aldolase/citrate lyase family protein n=1 Tax=Mameliella sediminis TaxID=2836866 RepID=UPI001C44BAC5|nr:CoA ester lyase [Mameliella sediminis]MBV7394098.1 CoA ester lyase [Mameliella sediminis]
MPEAGLLVKGGATEMLWRSLLYTPGHQPALAAKAARSAADVVILDLEDAVPPDAKALARKCILESAPVLAAAGKEVAVRINSPAEMQRADLAAAVAAGADIVIVPKVESAAQIRDIADQLAALEPPGRHTALIALIETPLGLHEARSIALAHPRLRAINLGTEDFAREMGMEPDWDSLLYPSQQVAIAAKAAGIAALGYAGSIAGFRDIDAFAKMLKKSSRLGFEGGFAIHPSQLAPLNAAFSPGDAEIALAREIVARFEEARAQGVGAISVQGRMVDLPVAQRAEAQLRRAELCRSREAG